MRVVLEDTPELPPPTSISCPLGTKALHGLRNKVKYVKMYVRSTIILFHEKTQYACLKYFMSDKSLNHTLLVMLQVVKGGVFFSHPLLLLKHEEVS